MKRSGQLVFLAAVVGASALYALTVPEGLPWNVSSHLALAYLGEIVRLPAMPHRIWGFHVQVFGGSVALSVFMAAMAAGLLAAIVNRYLGWRVAVGVALVWIFLPPVWNRAITGERSVCLAAMVVVVLWAANTVAWWATRRVRAARRSAPTVVAARGGGLIEAALPTAAEVAKRKKRERVVGWTVLGAAGLFAVASASFHDYRLGEPASVFAKGVVEAAGGRIVMLNGACDDQVVKEVEKRGGCGHRTFTLSLRADDAYRTNLVAWVKREWPSDTNLWVSARLSPQAFVEAATKRFPERFYLMNGKSTTPEQWAKRWESFHPYLKSSDPFVPVARRLFAYEGNMLAGDLDSSAAWQIYKRIYEEVDLGNFSALVNMSEMIRRGYAVSGDERKKVQERLETFFKDVNKRKHMREIAHAAGPVRVDHEMMEKMAAEAKKRVAEKIAAGEKIEYSPEILSLVEWNNEMVRLIDRGEFVPAGRIARAILSNSKWREFVPANAVMGAVSAKEGDYVASESFFRTALGTTNKVAAVTLNDFADTLMHLGKLDEAEKISRRAVVESDAEFWLARLTLAQVLEKKAKARGEGEGVEVGELLKSVLKHAPMKVRERIRKEHKEFLR